MGEIEVLIYNARGSFASREPLELTYEELEDNYRLEVVGALASAKSVLPAMRERGKGSVFFSSATAAYRGSATHALYAIGKFGLRGVVPESSQGIFEGRCAHCSCSTGLRSRYAAYARDLWRRI